MGEFGLLFFNARWLDPALGRFAQADTLIPEASQGTQAWDRYAAMNNNPVRYIDPSGYWTEDQLQDWLGDDWYDVYFGEGGIFEDRDKLLDFLRSEETTDILNLAVIKEFFQLATYMDAMGINLENYDAIGCRFFGMYGAGGVAGGSVDAVLNLKSGELSYFGSVEGGGGYGATTSGGAGYFVIKNLPTNSKYQGPGKSFGSSIAHFGGVSVEEFFAGKINGKSDIYKGLFVGGVIGEGFTPLYGTVSYTFAEVLNVSQTGYGPFNYFNINPINILSEIGDMLWNDIFKF